MGFAFTDKIKSSAPGLLSILAATAMLCAWAVFNGYPLVYPDTGTYISSSFRHYVPIDRSVMYSMFLRRTSFDHTLWLTVAAQALLAAVIIHRVFKQFLPEEKRARFYLPAMLLLTATTGIAVNTGQLIADIFTPVAVLAFILLLLSRKQTRAVRMLLLALLVISIPMHFSHFPLFILLLFAAWLAWFFVIRKKAEPVFRLRELAWCASSLVLSGLFLVLVNFTVDGKFTFRPKGSHVFTMQRLIHCGILTDYLEKNCPDLPPALCKAREYLPQIDFMWDDKTSPVYADSTNWMDHKEEYDKIISAIFSEPAYLRQFAWCSMRDTWKQIFHFNTGTAPPLGIGSAPHGEINWHYRGEVDAYLGARQQQETLDFGLVNGIQQVVVWSSVFIILLVLAVPAWRKCLRPPHRAVGWLILAAYLFNAFSCVTFAVIDDRFSARLAWLFPLVLLAWISDKEFRDRLWAVLKRGS